jgi:hypothetical protein
MAAPVRVLSERTVTLKMLAAESEMEDLLQEINKDVERVHDFSGLLSSLSSVINAIAVYHIVSLQAPIRNAQEKFKQATVLLQKKSASIRARQGAPIQFLSEKSVSLKILAAGSEIEDLYKQIQTSSGYRYIDFFCLLAVPVRVIKDMGVYRTVSLQVPMKNAVRKAHVTMILLQNISTAALQERIIAFSDSLMQMQNTDFMRTQEKIKQQFAYFGSEIAFFSKMSLQPDAKQSLSVSKISLRSVEKAYQTRLHCLTASGEHKHKAQTLSAAMIPKKQSSQK